MLFALLRGLLRFVQALVVLVVVYVAVCMVLYRDIPPAQLEAEYASPDAEFVIVDGVRMLVRVDGSTSEDAPTMVMIHSHYLDSRMWDDTVAGLQVELPDWRFLRFDLTSHGLTGPEPEGDYSMQRDLTLLRGLIEHYGISEPVIVGSSLGGNIAFHYSARHADSTKALVLINSGGLKRAQSSSRNAGAIPDQAWRILYLVPGSAFRAFLEWMVHDPAAIDQATARRFHRLLRRSGNRQAEMRRMASFDAGEPGPVLAAITAPVLLLWGQQNPQLPVALSERFEKSLTASAAVKRIVVEGAGHVLPLEKPRRTASEMAEFLKGALQ